MRKFLYALLLMLPMLQFTSCEPKESEPIGANQVPVWFDFNMHAFFPNASNVKWEAKFGYTISDFYSDGLKMQAWFDEYGTLKMTVVHYDNDTRVLSDDIVKTIASAGYADAHVNDITHYKREEINYWVITVKTDDGAMCIVTRDNGYLSKVCLADQLGVILPNTVF